MPLLLEPAHLAGDLLLGQRAALELPVPDAEGAVEALVPAEVRDVERREDHEPLAVDRLLHPPGRVEELAEEAGVGNAGEDGEVAAAEPLHLEGLREEVADLAGVRIRGADARSRQTASSSIRTAAPDPVVRDTMEEPPWPLSRGDRAIGYLPPARGGGSSEVRCRQGRDVPGVRSGSPGLLSCWRSSRRALRLIPLRRLRLRLVRSSLVSPSRRDGGRRAGATRSRTTSTSRGQRSAFRLPRGRRSSSTTDSPGARAVTRPRRAFSPRGASSFSSRTSSASSVARTPSWRTSQTRETTSRG